MRPLFLLVGTLLALPVQAAYQWTDTFTGKAWRTANEACILGEAAARVAAKRLASPSSQYHYVSANAQEILPGQSQCRYVIERLYFGFWITDTLGDHLHNRTGSQEACSLTDYADAESGLCGAPKGGFGPTCEAGANGSNPIHSASGNKYQVETDY